MPQWCFIREHASAAGTLLPTIHLLLSLAVQSAPEVVAIWGVLRWSTHCSSYMLAFLLPLGDDLRLDRPWVIWLIDLILLKLSPWWPSWCNSWFTRDPSCLNNSLLRWRRRCGEVYYLWRLSIRRGVHNHLLTYVLMWLQVFERNLLPAFVTLAHFRPILGLFSDWVVH